MINYYSYKRNNHNNMLTSSSSKEKYNVLAREQML